MINSTVDREAVMMGLKHHALRARAGEDLPPVRYRTRPGLLEISPPAREQLYCDL